MRVRTRWMLAVGLILAAVVSPTFAGGWAVVVLDTVPDGATATTPLTLGFTVLQHGVTPIDNDPFEGGPLKPFVTAHNAASGATVKVDARKQGARGHFVADVTFPEAGTWAITITPPPFAGTELAPLTVKAAPAAASEPKLKPASEPIAAPAAVAPSVVAQPNTSARWALPALVLVGATGLALGLRRISVRSRLRRTTARGEV